MPHGIRGQRILAWIADMAWLASPANPRLWVRRWCRRLAPSLTDAEIDQFVADAATSNKNWSNDQSATVLELGVSDREQHELWFLGADDDPDYSVRRCISRDPGVFL
jgi:hypothetical protein